MKDRHIMNHKLPPHNLEAEQSILGVILIDNEKMPNVLESISTQDFYKPAHQKIFEAMISLYQANEPIDLITLTNRLKQKGSLEVVGGAAYLSSLMDVPMALHNVEYYVKIVKDKSALQALIHATSRIMTMCFEDEQDGDEILGQAEAAIFGILNARIKTSAVHVSEVLKENIEAIEAQYNQGGFVNGIPSGFKDLDNLTTGFKPQELIVIAGRPGMGKTAFALNIAGHITGEGIPVLIFSLEMSRQQLGVRLLCSEAKVDSNTLRKGFLTYKELERLFQTKDRLEHVPFFIDDTRTITLLEMRAKARRIKMEHGLGLVIVDYLQLMQGSRDAERRDLAVAEISRGLRALAQELDVPVIALSQLNREPMRRKDKRPQLSDLRESGSIEQDADVVTFVHREDALGEEGQQGGVAEIIIAKQRNGPTDTVKLAFLKEYTRFEDLSYVAL